MNIVLGTVERWQAFGNDFLLCYDTELKRTTVCSQDNRGRIQNIEKSWNLEPGDLFVDRIGVSNRTLRVWLYTHLKEISLKNKWYYDSCKGNYDPIIPRGFKAVPLHKMSGTNYIVMPLEDYVELVQRWLRHCKHCR